MRRSARAGRPGRRPARRARMPAELLREATGWDIPVTALSAWVRGARGRRACGAARLQFGADGRLSRIEQGGWTIDYSDWQPQPALGIELPHRLNAAPGRGAGCAWSSTHWQDGAARRERGGRRDGWSRLAGAGQAQPVPADHRPPRRRLPRAADRVPAAGLGRPDPAAGPRRTAGSSAIGDSAAGVAEADDLAVRAAKLLQSAG